MSSSAVSFVLRRQPSAGAPQHLGPIISSFLGPSPHLSFHRSCDFGSVVLLDWMWSCSCPSVATRPSKWSLTNFLRSDPHYHRWEFSISMEMAASRGDLEIIKWVFSHFSDCKVPLEAVEAAATNGHLAVLQYLLEHDANNQENARLSTKKRKVVTESGELVSVRDSPATTKATQIVCWRKHEVHDEGLVKMAVDNGHTEVARWLYDNIPTERDDIRVRGAIEAALNRNDMALAESFVPTGQDVMQYAGFCTRNVEVVEHMIDSGYLQANSYFGAEAIKTVVAFGRLDLMRRIEGLKYSPRRNIPEWEKAWRDLLKIVSSRGDRAMIRWALGHRRGRRACRQLRRDGQLYQLLWNAVAGGCGVEVLQSLKDAGSVDKYGPALVEAVARNDMDSITWLLDNFPQSERISDYCVLDEAARRGYLHLLKYFQSLPSAPGFVPSTATIQKREMDGVLQWSSCGAFMNVASRDVYRNTLDDRHWQRSSWDSTDAMDNAAANGHLETVQWLHVNRTEGCSTDAIDCAAANGHLEVVKWLHANRSEGLTIKAMDGAAANAHLHVVKWLQEHTNAGCTTHAMDWAAEHGHLSVVKWLHAHRSEGCTSKAVKECLQNGHLAVASWFKCTFPQLKPQDVDLTFHEKVSFPVVLFIQEHYADLLTHELFGEYSFGDSSEDYLMDWMQENGLREREGHLDDWMFEA